VPAHERDDDVVGHVGDAGALLLLEQDLAAQHADHGQLDLVLRPHRVLHVLGQALFQAHISPSTT
jgi:hypothetical protein